MFARGVDDGRLCTPTPAHQFVAAHGRVIRQMGAQGEPRLGSTSLSLAVAVSAGSRNRLFNWPLIAKSADCL
jgi:hypothetical protein